MISGDITVARLLDEHPELIEVLARYHPHFRQLRNKLLSRVMAPRVTVAQAARIAGVPLDDLLNALRRSSGETAPAPEPPRSASRPCGARVEEHMAEPASASAPPTPKPGMLDLVLESRQVHLDVRADIQRGQEPFVRIMAAVNSLAPDQVLVLRAPFGHALWVVRLARHRKRPRLDWGLRFVLTGTAYMFPVTLLGLGFAFGLLSGPQLGTAYAVLALGGWVSLTIAGMMLKIVPFLVWYRVYAPQVGKAPVPTLPQLAWPAAEATAYGLLTAAMISLPIAIAAGHVFWIRATATVLSLGALAFGGSLGRILWHFVRGAARAAAARPAPASAR